MPSVTHTFTLERPARKSGGDRYEEVVPNGDPTIMGRTYVNQSISRPAGVPVASLEITITAEED